MIETPHVEHGLLFFPTMHAGINSKVTNRAGLHVAKSILVKMRFLPKRIFPQVFTSVLLFPLFELKGSQCILPLSLIQMCIIEVLFLSLF